MVTKKIFRIAISVVLMLLIATASWYTIVKPNKASLSISKVEAEEIAQERYDGQVTKSEEKGASYIITIKTDTGEYDITIASDSGEVKNIVQTIKEELIAILSEEEIEEIILNDSDGEIESITKVNKNNTAFYDAVLKNKENLVTYQVNGKTGEIVDKKEEAITSIKMNDAPTKEASDQKKQVAKKETPAKQAAPAKKAPAEKKAEAKPAKQEKPKNISEKKAIQIALDTVKGEVDDVDLERSNGQLYYFIEVETAEDTEAEIQIHAITGEVISIEWDD